jgi:hypothetical protein
MQGNMARAAKTRAGGGKLVQEAKKQVVLLGSESLYCIRTHSYCVDQRWGSEVARATACAGLLILKVAGVLGRAGGLPSGPILSGPSRTQRKKLHIFSPS